MSTGNGYSARQAVMFGRSAESLAAARGPMWDVKGKIDADGTAITCVVPRADKVAGELIDGG